MTSEKLAVRDGSSQKNSNQVDSVEKLVADVNGVEIGALFDESSL